MERFHRTLKSAIMSRNNASWAKELPMILLGFRSTLKEDFEVTPAEMLYGQTFRLPGEVLHSSENLVNEHEFFIKFRE